MRNMKATNSALSSRSRLALTCAVVVLGGCTSIPEFQQPEVVDAAKLRVVVPNPEQFSIHLAKFELAQCKPEANIGWVSGGAKIDTVRVGMLDTVPPRDGLLERRIAPGVPTAMAPSFTIALLDAATILFSMNPATHGRIRDAQAGACRLPAFTPKPNAEYELVIKMAASAECFVSLSTLTLSEEGKVARTPVASVGEVVLQPMKKRAECIQPQASASASP